MMNIVGICGDYIGLEQYSAGGLLPQFLDAFPDYSLQERLVVFITSSEDDFARFHLLLLFRKQAAPPAPVEGSFFLRTSSNPHESIHESGMDLPEERAVRSVEFGVREEEKELSPKAGRGTARQGRNQSSP